MPEDYAALVAHVRDTQTITIVTTRSDGTPVAAPIWAVVVDGVPYVRAAYGGRTSWFARAVSGRPVTVSLADGSVAERDREAALEDPQVMVAVRHLEATGPVQDEVTAAYEAKYLPTSPENVPSVTDEAAVARTLALLPPAD
ncbi:DUF2255 family protein [Microbacterium sp. SORGH_AS_0888]|uniref:DUF2255 family protein n=1 Tax=Microbacterium sp. SORGH_AS_0888 TaxID=3041791 RepID=UPI0027D80B39|nr:DUF2255 family protein [Microbacterium sp. SORGH_AS_0888]